MPCGLAHSETTQIENDETNGCLLMITLDLTISDRFNRLVVSVEPALPGVSSSELNSHMVSGSGVLLGFVLMFTVPVG